VYSIGTIFGEAKKKNAQRAYDKKIRDTSTEKQIQRTADAPRIDKFIPLSLN